MHVVPAIDISRGRLVRLVKGSGNAKVYGDPAEWLETLISAGARTVHIVDLDAARGRGENRALAAALAARASEAGLTVQFGGGLRSTREALEAASWGNVRVVLGTLIYTNPQAARSVLSALGPERVMAAIDVRRGKAALRGWRSLGPPLGEAARLAETLGFTHVLYTDVERDGTLLGPPRPPPLLTRRFKVTVAGGVASEEHLEELARAGAYAVVVGKALLEGRLSLERLSSMGWEV